MVTSNSRDEGRREGLCSHPISFFFSIRALFHPLSLSLIRSLWSNLSTLYPQLVSLYVLTGTALLNALAIWSSTPLIYIIRLFLTRGRLSLGDYAPLERSNGQSNMTIHRKEIKNYFLHKENFHREEYMKFISGKLFIKSSQKDQNFRLTISLYISYMWKFVDTWYLKYKILKIQYVHIYKKDIIISHNLYSQLNIQRCNGVEKRAGRYANARNVYLSLVTTVLS